LKELYEILQEHFLKYPLWEVFDAVKLVYQNEFGGGHIVSDSKKSLERIRSEYASVDSSDSDVLFEDIGNNLSRLNFAAAKFINLSPEDINNIFLASAIMVKGSIESFEKKLDILQKAVPFDFSDYLNDYKKANYPMVSHSDIYKREYHPAYRIVNSYYSKLISIIQKIASVNKEQVVIAIDGMSASGKTTAASFLSKIYDCNVFHMDDFFLTPELRNAKRRGEPGGNVHYERFMEEVVIPLQKHEPFKYRVFDCGIMDYAKEPISVTPKKINIIEGAYCMRPEFQEFYDVKVFWSVPYEVQKMRILKRNGDNEFINYRDLWIPLENKYFEFFDIQNKCEIITEG